jgi:hypothetical protein
MRLRTRLEALRTAIFTEVKIMPVTKPVTANLQVHFASLTDPRRRKITHPLLNFIVIAICAKNKRLSAGWDEDYLLQVLVGT